MDGVSRFKSLYRDTNELDGVSRFKCLYPYTDVKDLPKAWSSVDRSPWISLSENNLKAHYKGSGKGHKDAAAVRATCSIPQSCLLYYFEMKIISKGRDGYMGIGLAAADVNMARLPGWDKNSYGYHGDDGHSFCSSGTGVSYGPTFTTGDVIGCGYNLVENTCFYTKNGLNLGRAFSDLAAAPLYPTVGLQTPGEEVEANFGMEPFIYDIEDDIRALRQRITNCIIHFPVPFSELQSTMNTLVQSWLVHNGYCSTAQVFSAATKQPFTENVIQIKQRLRIQQLVLSGRIEQAIRVTDKLYPDVLQNNPNLKFALKCRQFIEMIDGANRSSAKSSENNASAKQPLQQSCSQDKSEQQVSNCKGKETSNSRHNVILPFDQSSNSSNGLSPSRPTRQQSSSSASNATTPRVSTRQMVKNKMQQQDHLTNSFNSDCNGNSNHGFESEEEDFYEEDTNTDTPIQNNNEEVDLMQMETDEVENGHLLSHGIDEEEEEVEDGLLLAVSTEELLLFGRQLKAESRDISNKYGEAEPSIKLLNHAFALIAYPNPRDTELGWLLNPSEREVVCQQLNNAIVMSEMASGNRSSQSYSRQPHLESIIKHCKTLLKLNNQWGTWLVDKL